MKLLVTGGCGFIGSHLVTKLLEQGHEVIVLDDLSTGFKEYLLTSNSNLTLVKIDISSWYDLSKCLYYFLDVDCVFHLAAIARIQPSIENPSRTHEVNVTGIFNILEAMRITGVKNIVYSSSSSIYGLKNKSPLVESMPPDCLNPYSMSKRVGELYCDTWGKLYGIKSVALRYFNVYGIREVLDGPYAPVIGLFFKQTLKQREKMTIIGDGEQRRDFTHVSDVVEANILAMKNIEKASGAILNIGTGKNYSVNEVATMVENAIKQKIGVNAVFPYQYTNIGTIFVKARPGESRETIANIELAKTLIGYEPTVEFSKALLQQRDYYMGLYNPLREVHG